MKTDVFLSECEAAAAWSNDYRRLSEKNEYASFIYSRGENERKRYYTGRTYKGMSKHGPIRPNVFFPLIYLFMIESLKEWFKYRSKVEAMVHTHPKPPVGFSYRSHSREDLWLLKLPRINAVYVVPYENNEINREPGYQV